MLCSDEMLWYAAARCRRRSVSKSIRSHNNAMLLPCGTLGTMHDDKIIFSTRTDLQLTTLSRGYTQILGANIFGDDHREDYSVYIVKRDVYIVYKISVLGDSSCFEIVVPVADEFDSTCEGGNTTASAPIGIETAT